jgi:hypothetical protein
MTTIFQNPDSLRLLGSASVVWTDNAPLIWSGGAGTVVMIDGIAPALSSIVGGEQFQLTRGSTAQIAQTVTLAAPGAPGTKTLAQVVTDINAVFGIAGGAPTEFAYEFAGHVRLIDKTVGMNIGRAAVDAYIGANNTIQDGVFKKVGLPVGINRSIATVAAVTRMVDVALANDNGSIVSSTALALPDGSRELEVEIGIRNEWNRHRPILIPMFSDGSAAYEPPFNYVLTKASIDASIDPAVDISGIVRARPLGGVAIDAPSPPFQLIGVLGQPPMPQTRTRVRFPVPPWATFARVAIIGCQFVDVGVFTRFAPEANVVMRVFG